MAHTSSAKKRARQSNEDRLRNRAGKSLIRTMQQRLFTAVAGKDAKASDTAYRAYCAALDKAVKKGIIRRNQAIRKKQRGAERLRSLKTAA
jgi:small subunit ribosomal protein S20